MSEPTIDDRLKAIEGDVAGLRQSLDNLEKSVRAWLGSASAHQERPTISTEEVCNHCKGAAGDGCYACGDTGLQKHSIVSIDPADIEKTYRLDP